MLDFFERAVLLTIELIVRTLISFCLHHFLGKMWWITALKVWKLDFAFVRVSKQVFQVFLRCIEHQAVSFSCARFFMSFPNSSSIANISWNAARNRISLMMGAGLYS